MLINEHDNACEPQELKTVKVRVSQNKCIWWTCLHPTVTQLCICFM